MFPLKVCTSVKCHSSRQYSQKLQTRNKFTSFVSVLAFIIPKCFSFLSLLPLLTHRYFTHPLVIFPPLFSSTKCSANNCLQEAAVLHWWKAGRQLYDIEIKARAPHNLAYKWKAGKNFSSCRDNHKEQIQSTTLHINGRKVNIWIAMFIDLFMSFIVAPLKLFQLLVEYSLPSQKRYLISIRERRDKARSNELNQRLLYSPLNQRLLYSPRE